jgi:hypothetical protein
MMVWLPLHASLDWHDGLAVVVFVLTLALGSVLGALRRRGGDLTPPPAGGTAPTAVGTRPRGEGEALTDA